MLNQKMMWIRRAATLGAFAAALLAAAPRAEAQVVPGSPDKLAFGLFGITRGQSARVNVFIGNPNLIGNPDFRPGDPQAACHVTVSFVDEMGAPFLDRTGRRISADGSVRPGQSLGLDIHSFDIFRAGDGRRRQIRAVAWGEQVPGNPDAPSDACLLPAVLTAEIYDRATGHTSVLYALPLGFLPAVQ